MPTLTTVDAAWDTGITLDHAELRRADTTMFLGDGSSNGVRGGIVRHGDTSLAVTVNGSDQVTVQPGAFVVPAATGLGVYRGSLQSAVGPGAGTAVSARNGTNPRIDLVVIQVGTGTGAIVKTIDGTPSSSPVAPALPAQHIELARLTVPQVGGGAITVDSTWRAYATALGGTLYVETSARLPGSGNQKGQRALALDTGLEYFWTGTAWLRPGTFTAYTPAIINANAGTGATFTGRWTQIGSGAGALIHARAKVALGTGFSLSPGVGLTTPVSIANAITWTVTLTDTGTNAYQGAASPQVTHVQMFFPGTNGILSIITGTAPFTWVAGDTLEYGITYEPV
jgi:hypothetical protein